MFLIPHIRNITLPYLIFFTLTGSCFGQSNSTDISWKIRKDGYLEVFNGNLGLLMPTEALIKKNLPKCLAPVQSFIYSNGIFSDNTPNYLNLETAPVNIEVKTTYSGDSVKIIFLYLFNKPKFKYYDGNYKGGDAGPGYYKCTIIIRKGLKSISFEEDSNYEFFYEVKISNGLNPDQARYRGWISTSPEFGYEESLGKSVQSQGFTGDATVDLSYDKFRFYPYLSLWDPAGGEINTGRYWQVFNKNGNKESNLFGFFQGRPSRMINAAHVGVRLLQNINGTLGRIDTEKDSTHIALGIESFRRGPDNSWFPRKRFEWAVFISKKNDLLTPKEFQPIGLQMNMVSGLGSRIEKYARQPLILSPSIQDLSLYMPAANIQAIIKKVKTEDTFYQYILSLDPSFKYILDAWRFPDSIQSARKSILSYYSSLKRKLLYEDGIHSFEIKYWMGSFNFKKKAIQISCLLADKSIQIPIAEKEKYYELLRLMARIQWDNDNVPFYDSSGINFGPANMSYQYKNNGRNFFALLFAKDPEFKERANKILKETRNDLLGIISENGMSFGSPHYIQATIDPILFTMLQLKQAGIADLFKEEKDRLLKFIDFYKSLVTPPSVRFNNNRKLISFGDGSEESAVTFGLLGAGFKTIDTSLSSNLYHLYENGTPRMSIFGEIAISIDMQKHSGKFETGTSNYKGYLSHFRSGLNTDDESAAWILNGERFFDHRNQDRGETAIYALKAPLSLSRSCFYYPHATDARIRSVVIPESLFPGWNGINQPIKGEDGKGEPWLLSDQQTFAKLKYSSISISNMENGKTKWIRKFMMISANQEEPVFIYYDSVNNSMPNIWSILSMSEGTVETPAGKIKPAEKIHNNYDQKQLPEGTTEKQLSPQWHTFRFTGQRWPLHSTGGINWNMHIFTNTNSSFSLAQWTNTWQNDQEQNQFYISTKRNYTETQQILRWKSTLPFFAIIIPSLKSAEKIKQTGSNAQNRTIELTGTKGIYTISPFYFTYAGKNGNRIYTSLISLLVRFSEFSVSGGPTEIEFAGKKMIVRASGGSGNRKIEFNGKLSTGVKYNNATIQQKGNKSIITIDFKRKEIDISSEDPGFTEYIFDIQKP